MSTKRYPCRCLKCRHRRSLNHKPDDYVRPPKCKFCGSTKWWLDTYRMKKEMDSKLTCNCGGYWFPHRKGSKFCHYHPNAEQIHTEEAHLRNLK